MHIDMQSSPSERFREFFQAYQDENGRYVYVEQVQKMSLEGLLSLFVNYDDLLRFDPVSAKRLREEPEDTIRAADDALVEVLVIEDPIYASSDETAGLFHVRFSNLPDIVDLRRLRSVHLGNLLSVEGIIIRQTVVKPLLIQGIFQCTRKGCEEVHFVPQEGGYYTEPSKCNNPQCTNTSSFKLLTKDKNTIYTDFQSVTVQEKPESLPPGQIPRSVPARLIGDLVDTVRAGDRAIVSGILRMKIKGKQKGKLATFDPWLDVNFVSSREKEFEEIDIDPDTEQEILALSTDINIHRRIVRSVAPSIYGMETLKEALATVLFGGVSRVAPDGMKQRGDSNLLMIGDPGVAKSQLLQYVHRLAPRGLLTSGKASSAAGLTAAVIRDAETGEFGLEAGALVLADRGICCIDEFDKMNPTDRSSIHEAMEQQSYHPSFEISFLDGQKLQIGSFVDNLFKENEESKIIGKDCEILPVENHGFNVLTTDFKTIYDTNVNRVSRHIAPEEFIRIIYSNDVELLVTPEHPIYVLNNDEVITIDAENAKKGMLVPSVSNEKIELDRVKIIKTKKLHNKGELATKWVYDVTIEPTENFISHGLVLHNTVSIAKAGIVAQLNARTAIIAAANPRFGRYEDSRPPVENINLPPTILSRFDLIYIIRDVPDVETDKRMARHILELRRGHVIEDTEPTITMDLLRKYISYAKQHIQPALTDDAMERIEQFYLNLRKESDESSAIAITPRYLEAIIRLSESQARMALKEDVTIDHVEAAINLLRASLEQAGKDPVTGRVDIDYLLSGTTKTSRSKMQIIIDIMKEESRVGSSDVVSIRRIKELAKEQNIDDEFVDRVINQLRSNGEIYSPSDGFVKLA
ncbi:MAG: hypothetical protein GPJ51_02780 [Candidatus Heimdallarchaeota archaeon]|nr:hypothetical protein [Candidatus Heimdallarchaeota archaeon]